MAEHKWADVLRAIATRGLDATEYFDHVSGGKRVYVTATEDCNPLTRPDIEWRIRQEPVSDFVQWYRAGKHYCYMEQSTRANLRLTLDGETGKLKSAEVLP